MIARTPHPDLAPWQETAEGQQAEQRDEQGRVIVYTDGSCKAQGKHPLLRVAGFGAYWGEGHPANVSAKVGGPHQTNQHGELLAVCTAAERDNRSLHIKTDSAYVKGGFDKLSRGGTAPQQGPNAALWATFADLLVASRDRIFVSKVLGHAKWKHVRRGLTTRADKLGNDAADKLAVQGSDMHPPSIQLQRASDERKESLMKLQRMLLDICIAREDGLRNIMRDEGENVNVPPNLPNSHPPFGAFAQRALTRGRKRRRPLP